jgi:beta-glucanase (GH16 family)
MAALAATVIIARPRSAEASEVAVLDRVGLVETFRDDFTTFSWYAEGTKDGHTGGGTWRTNYGYGKTSNALLSRTLLDSGGQEIYVDPAFRGTADQPLDLNPFSVTDGVLSIKADRTPENAVPYVWGRHYTSGVMTTRYTFSQLFGVFEIRARMPKGRGFWPAFWLLPADRSWPPELDVLEILGHEPTTLHVSWHSKAGGKHTSKTISVHVPDTSEEFHTYSVEWGKDEIAWYFDDKEIARQPTPEDMRKPMYLLANLGVGGYWPGNPDASTPFPSYYAIDWIRVYRRDTLGSKAP